MEHMPYLMTAISFIFFTTTKGIQTAAVKIQTQLFIEMGTFNGFKSAERLSPARIRYRTGVVNSRV
jgi:hypothetical protein